ncbi:MAG: exostosin family protein [Spartobacteria bacterium]
MIHPKEVTDSLPPLAEACYDALHACFAIQQRTTHTLASNPDAADFILAPIQGEGYGPCFEALRDSAFYRRHAAKLIAYSPDGNQFPAIRGLYPSISRQWVRKGWALPAHYISSHYPKFRFTEEEIRDKDILFSFVGSSRTHPMREKIVRWRHPRAALVDVSAGADPRYWWERDDRNDFVALFRDVARRSQFVICPRGISPSSIRLFEAMEAGAVPVIVSDKLELPLGPDWDKFSFHVREQEIEALPQMIEGWQDRAASMGATARKEWQEHFAPQAAVASVIRWSRLLLAGSHRRTLKLRLKEYTNPHFVKTKVRVHLKQATVPA